MLLCILLICIYLFILSLRLLYANIFIYIIISINIYFTYFLINIYISSFIISYYLAPHEKLIGLLLFFHIIGESDSLSRDRLEKSTLQSGLNINEILWKFLLKKDSRDMELKRKVMGVMPSLASIYNEVFNNKIIPVKDKKDQKTFLQYFVTHLIDTIRQKKERQLAYTTLGKLFLSSQTLSTSQTLVNQCMAAVTDGFKEPFCREALSCFTHMVSVSQSNCRRHVTPELIDSMFIGGLTEELVMTCNAIMRNMPIIRGYVQKQIMNHITSVLQKHMTMDLAQRTASVYQGQAGSKNTADTSIKANNNNSNSSNNNNTSSNMNFNSYKLSKSTANTSGREQLLISSNISQLTAATPVKPYNTSLWSFFSSSAPIETDPVLSADEQLTFALKVLATHDFFAKSTITRDIHNSQTRESLSPLMSVHGNRSVSNSINRSISNSINRSISNSINTPSASNLVINALTSSTHTTANFGNTYNTTSTHNMSNQGMMSASQIKKVEEYNDFNPLGTLISIVSDSVVVYLDNLNPEIRLAAATSCLAVLDTIIVKIESLSYDYVSAARILDRLLHLGRYRYLFRNMSQLLHYIIPITVLYSMP